MGDLIDHHNRIWKVDLVRKLYPFPQANEILQIAISKTDSVQDKLLWKYSRGGNYQVKRAYELIAQDIARQSRPCRLRMAGGGLFGRLKFL